MRRAARCLLLAGAVALPVAGDAVAQSEGVPRPAVAGARVDQELESYLRALQLLGKVPLRSWSVRAFSPAELAELAPADTTDHPWAGRFDLSPPDRQPEVGWVPAEADAVYNSPFPYGFNDGALWAGRGANLALSGGAWAKAGPLRVTVAPVLLWAQNQGFGGEDDFRDWRVETIDHPVRFGSGSVARLDWGASEARLDLRGVALGVGTAEEVWGPAEELPLILGRNAPGFLHAFLGTSRPVDIGIGRLHARVVAGRLEQSDHAPESRDSVRLATAWVVSFRPRGLDALEVGGTRFFHQEWGEGPGGDDLRRIFESFLKSRFDGEGSENQLASIFARLALPWGGTEVYAEFAREDHSGSLRDVLGEPDHTGALTVGVARAWEAGPGRVRLFRAELLEALPDREGLGRGSSHFYTHTQLRQGHTHRGQVLGSPAAVGGRAVSLRADEYSPSGRRGVFFRREVVAEAQVASRLGADVTKGDDVLYVAGAEVARFRPGGAVLRFGGAVLGNLNRRFGGDRWGVRLRVGIGGF